MSEDQKKQLEQQLWNIANTLRGKMNADKDYIREAFDKFWNEEQQKAFMQLVREENLSAEKTRALIEDYPLFSVEC